MADTELSNKLPEPEEMLLRVPLYEEFKVFQSEEQLQALSRFAFFSGSIDAYCIDCGQASVFQFIHPHLNDNTLRYDYLKITLQKPLTIDQSFALTAHCSRNKSHKLFFYFLYKKGILIKIGQYPSIADMDAPDIKKYRKVLSPENFADLRRATGLKAHGIGAGSFIYLRRVFENLIEEAHLKATKDNEWSEDEYNRIRMEQKIELLASHLPKTLTELRAIYGIMSKGIHSLTENECLMYFDPVRIGIELILEEKLVELQEAEKQKKAQEAKNILSQIKSKIDS